MPRSRRTFRYLALVLLLSLSASRLNGQVATNLPSPIRPGGPEFAEVLALTRHPEQPGRLYAGTAGGVFESTDGGASWQARGNGLNSVEIVAIAIDPSDRNVLAAGSEGFGLFTSADAGLTWTRVDNVAPDSTVNAVVFAGGQLFAGGSAGLWRRNTDGVWSQIDVCESGRASCNSVIAGLAWSPAEAGTFYAAGNLGVYRSTDSAITWTRLTLPVCSNPRPARTPIRGIALDPSNAQRVMIGVGRGVLYTSDAALTWKCGQASSTVHGVGFGEYPYAWHTNGLIRTADDGDTWQSTTSPQGSEWRALATDPVNVSTLYLGGLTGIQVSLDSGRTWNAGGRGLAGGTWGAVTVVPEAAGSPVRTIVGLTARGIYRGPLSGGAWDLIPLPEGLSPSARLLASGQALFALSPEGCPWRSTDGGRSWARWTVLPSCPIYDVAEDPQSASTVYALAADALYRSTDSGATWVGLPESRVWLGLAVDRAGTVYTAVQNSIRVSRDRGDSWTAAASGLEDPLSLTADPTRPGMVFAAGRQGVRISDNGGLGWTAGQIPEVGVLSILVSSRTPDNLLALTTRGVWRSLDSGSTWTLSAFLGRDVLALAMDSSAGTMIASIRGAGLQVSTDFGQSWAPLP